jgi:hypothetical protein
MTQHRGMPWDWFVEKVLPGLFLLVAAFVGGTSFAVWNSVNTLTATVETHEGQIRQLRVEIDTLRNQAVTRSELLETMKRVEQQLEIMMLRNGLKATPRLVPIN